MREITVEGRRFSVEQDGDKYVLAGVCGAKYRTVRNHHNPSLMFLVNAKSIFKGAPDVWLTDRDGELEIVGAFI